MFGIFARHRRLKQQAKADAEALIARFGDGAYWEAREHCGLARRGVTVDGNRPAAHWDRVRMIIGRKTGRDGLDTATRYLESTD